MPTYIQIEGDPTKWWLAEEVQAGELTAGQPVSVTQPRAHRRGLGALGQIRQRRRLQRTDRDPTVTSGYSRIDHLRADRDRAVCRTCWV